MMLSIGFHKNTHLERVADFLVDANVWKKTSDGVVFSTGLRLLRMVDGGAKAACFFSPVLLHSA